jgi:hypothetical protein
LNIFDFIRQSDTLFSALIGAIPLPMRYL